jgi:hypothetical protein
MDREQFDRLSRLVAAAGTRRDALRLLVSGVVLGAAGIDGAPASARKPSRKGRHGKARAELQQPPPPSCPTTCNQNCSTKPIHGGVNLAKCNLNDRDLDGVQLNGANLTQACFGGSSLRNANFRGANLSKTCLCGADLRGADFRGANVTQQQLDCAKPGCDTIKPNGKPAIVCGTNETCCDGICVNTGSDADNCGACGHDCGPCQQCVNGQCGPVPNKAFDCNGVPLEAKGSASCTTTSQAGLCVDGACTCGSGRYLADPNLCVCLRADDAECAQDGLCCVIGELCTFADGQINTVIQCVDCP